MSIENESQLANTRTKLRRLQAACDKVKKTPGTNSYVDQLTLASLQSQIKQFKEEIAVYEARATQRIAAK